jgi:dTDP-4-dehydrorhamnose reductase
MKILITGSSGILGEAITNVLLGETVYELVLLSSIAHKLHDNPVIKRIQCSTTDLKEVKRICLLEKPDKIINCVSISNPLLCESDKKLAHLVNVSSVENLISISRVLDSHLIHISTEQVFSGDRGPFTEESKPEPINYYGKTRHLAENLCQTNLDKYTIVRTTPVYGKSFCGKSDFFINLINRLDETENVTVSKMHTTNPVYADDVAIGILRIIEKNRTGIYHFGGADFTSYFEAVRMAASVYGKKVDNLQPSDNFKQFYDNTKIPKNCGLITLKTETDLNVKPVGLQSGFIAQKHNTSEKNQPYLITIR